MKVHCIYGKYVDLDEYSYNINDSSLTRFYTHYKNGEMILSACRHGMPKNKEFSQFSKEEMEQYFANISATDSLKHDIRLKGYGYVTTMGGYPESNDSGPGTVDVTEISFVVPFNPKTMDEKSFIQFGLDMCRKYNQDSIMVSGFKDIAGGRPVFLNRNSNIEAVFNSFRPYKPDDKYYTVQKNGKGFVIDAVDLSGMNHLVKYYFGIHVPVTMNDSVMMRKDGEIADLDALLNEKED
jgi:hypothetical protein